MKTVLITGAGRGLGRAIANAYHQAGFFVIASDISFELLSDLEDQENTTLFQIDVSNEEEVELAAAKINKLFGKLDVLVSNAGIFDFYPVSSFFFS